jgi:hypothetical protein
VKIGKPLAQQQEKNEFEAFGVFQELLDRAGVVGVTDAQARENYGIKGAGDMSGIIFPYFDPLSGARTTARLRRDRPEAGPDGKPENKYISPWGDNRHLYFPPGAGTLLADVSAPVVVVEAEKSVLALTGLAERNRRKWLAIATGGCWGWCGKNGIEPGPNGERQESRGPLPDFGLLAWLKRNAVVLFDSNVAINRKVQAARQALAEILTARGAKVFFCQLPQESGVNGPDDFIAQHGDEALLALIDAARPFLPVPGVRASEVKPESVSWLWPGYTSRAAKSPFSTGIRTRAKRRSLRTWPPVSASAARCPTAADLKFPPREP